jgi:mannose PTS system EIIA component
MPGILIIAHAPLASSLKACARHAYPEAEAIQALDVSPEQAPEVIEAEARALLALAAGSQTLVLTDVFGATPANVAQRLADGVNVKVVTGVNVPMLWRTLCYQKEPLDALIDRALAGAVQGVMQVASTRPQNQGRTSGNDQDHTQHQQ